MAYKIEALYLSMFSSPSPTSPLDISTPMMSTDMRGKLQGGEVILMGEKGQYRVLAIARVTHGMAWSVLTDYSNFHLFLPTVAESRIIESDGPRTIVEQLDRRRILMSTIESMVRTENVEMDQHQISFRLIEGNLKFMYGHWRLETVDWEEEAAGIILISQQVRAEADLGRPFKQMFYRLFEASLVETMAAIRDEMERRST